MGILDQLLSGKKIHNWLNHRNLFLLGLITIACGLAWAKILMSIGQFILIGNWIIEFGFGEKWKRVKSTKLLWVLLLLFLLHIIGLAWTEDFSYAWKDIRIKLPLLALPIIIASTNRLNKKEWRTLLFVYLGTIFILTLLSLRKLILGAEIGILDNRQLSIYISNIRYGLNICLSIFLIWRFNTILLPKAKPVLWLLAIWFLSCLFLFGQYTGLACFFIISGALLIYFILLKGRRTAIKFSSCLGIIAILGAGIWLIEQVKTDYYSEVELDYSQVHKGYMYSPSGGKYWSDIFDERKENGVYIMRFIARKEIEREWNKRSTIRYKRNDLKGQSLKSTLWRYLSSRGLKKDSVGIAKLSDEEVGAIEKGVANVYYMNHNSLQNRIHKTFYEIEEYNRTGDASGFSLAMRIEFWKTVTRIIKPNFWIGVGTGDVKKAFIDQYNSDNSKLRPQFRRRAHNQYLTFFATFGVFGFIIFLFYLLYPLSKNIPNKTSYLIFWGIVCLSFLTEDTLESQAGVTFFAFFNTILLLGLSDFSLKSTDNELESV